MMRQLHCGCGQSEHIRQLNFHFSSDSGASGIFNTWATVENITDDDDDDDDDERHPVCCGSSVNDELPEGECADIRTENERIYEL